MRPLEILDIIRKRLNREDNKNIRAFIILDDLPLQKRGAIYSKPGFYIIPRRYTAGDESLGLIGSFTFSIIILRDEKQVEGSTSFINMDKDISKVLLSIYSEGTGADLSITTGGVQFSGCSWRIDDIKENNVFFRCDMDFVVDCSFEGVYAST